MGSTIIRNGRIINRGSIREEDILIKDGRIVKTGSNLSVEGACEEVDASGKWVIPGIIDDQVHFREPGLTHKADIASESRAAVAGGTTSFMEMPNTNPPALTQELLEAKYQIAAGTSYANYSFFMGVSNENYDEVMRTSPKDVCGIKIFMGSSTGNMLVDSPNVLERIFAHTPMLIATHCEDEKTVRDQLEKFREKYGEEITPEMHPMIRSEEACYLSSSYAAGLAQKYGTRLHILHLTTEKELSLFRNDIPLTQKRITSEVCVHHLYFSDQDYTEQGNLIKCNPAIKEKKDKEALFSALLDDRLDIIATDHAPHTLEEKMQRYEKAPSGLPLVQHSLNIMMDFHWQGKITMEKIVEKMCHAPAQCFGLVDRGYLDEGMHADLVIIDPDKEWTVAKDNILYKCGWSPLEGKMFRGKVMHTYVNGKRVYSEGGKFLQGAGQRLQFDRQ